MTTLVGHDAHDRARWPHHGIDVRRVHSGLDADRRRRGPVELVGQPLGWERGVGRVATRSELRLVAARTEAVESVEPGVVGDHGAAWVYALIAGGVDRGDA